jgi:indole-3-glycerol phosphate synthase
LEVALAVDAPLIGVNNRNLKTFQVDLATTENLARRLREAGRLEGPSPVLLIAESGIQQPADVRRLRQAGARAMLVGESLVRSGDQLPSRIRALLGE